MPAPSPRPANRLASEKSPYLLQHARNPVDWFPWGEEAFARARREGRPIFLSIGYSTCHWCHVMERESFESEQVAALLNAHFVPIKVDREERPDVDHLYMTAMQAMGMGGGWPLNVFLTPELAPFHGGTYFPPETRHGRIGLPELLARVHEAWRERRADIEHSADGVLALLGGMGTPDREAQATAALLEQCAQWLGRQHDPLCGGFGDAPKFPSPGNLAFLWRWWAADPASRDDARAMALAQLDAMRRAGIHDVLGGGYHRYATDREWMVPHFEKMLYDQALLTDAALDAYEATRDPAYAAMARDILGYVARDLTAPEGGFYSAEDADSEGEEGRFYVWRPEQLTRALGEEAAQPAAYAWGVTPQGNFEHGTSILHEAHPLDDVARRFELAPGDAAARLAAARAALLGERSQRPRPHLDDKRVVAWNALMSAAMARAGAVLDEPEWIARAARAAAFVWDALRDPARGTLHRHFRGGAAGEGQLDDHAGYARACLALWQATADPLWLERAIAITGVFVERFRDPDLGGFYESPPGDGTVRVRMKAGFDGAELAGNSLALEVLARLVALTGRDDWRAELDRAVAYWQRRLAGQAWAMPHLLTALQRAALPPRHVVIAGDPGAADTRALLARHRGAFRPFEDLVVVPPGQRERLAAVSPFLTPLVPISGHATAYVCVDYSCRLPATDPAAFDAALAPEEVR